MIISHKAMVYFFIVTICLCSFLLSCTRIQTGGGQDPVVCTVNVSNPEFGVEIGFPINSRTNPFSPGFELEITVNTLDVNNNAVTFSTKTVQFTHADIVSKSLLSFSVDGVKLPIRGGYVIQYQLRSQDCTSFQTNGCYNSNFNGSASRKYFKDQRTIPSGNPGVFNFLSNYNLKYTEICC